MSSAEVQALTAAGEREHVQDAAGERGGNQVLVVGEGAGARVLKLYRRRRAWVRAPFRALENRVLGKRGVGPRARCETERATLLAWAQHGLRAPRWIDAPLPEGIDPPALWMEYTPGPTLHQVIAERETSAARVLELCERLGRELEQRHLLADRSGEVLLIPEHGGPRHALVVGDELVQIDHETGWRASTTVAEAIAQEYTMVARGLVRAAPPGGRCEEALLEAFVAGHGDVKRLCEVLAQGGGRGLGGWMHRLHDRYKRPGQNKQDAREGLLRVARARLAPAGR